MIKLRKLGKFILPIVLLGAIIFFPLPIYRKFQLKTLVIIDDQSYLRGLTILDGSNLLFIDPKKISTGLLVKNPTVKSIGAVKNFPQTIILKVENRIPIAQIVSGTNNMYIDRDGIIIIRDNINSGLPKIEAPNILINAGQKADWRIVKAASFIDETEKQGIIIDQISLNDASGVFSANTNSGTKILIPYDVDIPLKASSLQVIILRFRIEGKNINIIDFRFDKPIVILGSGEKISSTY